MIRVAIIANTLLRARSLADLLLEDDRLEIVEVRAASRDKSLTHSQIVDLIVFAGLSKPIIPLEGGPPVVMLTNEPLREVSIGPTVRAWLPLHSSGAEVAAAIVAAANNFAVLTQDQARSWLRDPESSHAGAALPVEALTSRELQVLRMLADGFGNREIAAQLRISDHTAKFHVAQILAKLGAVSRTEAVTIGIRRGLIPI